MKHSTFIYMYQLINTEFEKGINNKDLDSLNTIADLATLMEQQEYEKFDEAEGRELHAYSLSWPFIQYRAKRLRIDINKGIKIVKESIDFPESNTKYRLTGSISNVANHTGYLWNQIHSQLTNYDS